MGANSTRKVSQRYDHDARFFRSCEVSYSWNLYFHQRYNSKLWNLSQSCGALNQQHEFIHIFICKRAKITDCRVIPIPYWSILNVNLLVLTPTKTIIVDFMLENKLLLTYVILFANQHEFQFCETQKAHPRSLWPAVAQKIKHTHAYRRYTAKETRAAVQMRACNRARRNERKRR
jgi:hypothetical protein